MDELKKLERKKRAKKWGNALYVIVRGIIVCGVCYYVLFPILQSFFQTFMARADLYDSTVDLIPKNWTLDNLKIMFKAVNIPSTTLTTLGICLLVTATQLCSCTLVGYGFARFKFPWIPPLPNGPTSASANWWAICAPSTSSLPNPCPFPACL